MNHENTNFNKFPTPHEQEFYIGLHSNKTASDTVLLHQRFGLKMGLKPDQPQCDLLLEEKSGKKLGIIPRISLDAVWDKANFQTKNNTQQTVGISEEEWNAAKAKLIAFVRSRKKLERPVLIQDVLEISELDFERLFLHKASKVILLIDTAIKGDIAETARLKKRWRRIKKYIYKVQLDVEHGGIFSEYDVKILRANGINYLNQIRKKDVYYIKNLLLDHSMSRLVEELNAAFKEDLAKRRDFRFKFYPLLFSFLTLAGVTAVGYMFQYTLIKNANMTLVLNACAAAFSLQLVGIFCGVLRAAARRRKRPDYRFFSKRVRRAFGTMMTFALFANGSAAVFYNRYDGYDDILYYRDLKNDTIAVAGLRDESVNSLIIPTEIDGKTVTEIDIACFRSDNFSSVTFLPEELSVDHFAFLGCSNLSELDLTRVTSFGTHAFENCTSLQSVVLPERESFIAIPAYAFKKCGSLSDVQGLTHFIAFGDAAFADCSVLPNVTFNPSVSSIGSKAFSKCLSMTSVTLPDSLSYLGKGAFLGCDHVNAIVMPFVGTTRNTASEHSLNDFFACKADPFTLTLTQSDAIFVKNFVGCTSMTKLSMPENVHSIDKNSFVNLTSLMVVNIPDSVTVIEAGCFENCKSLTVVSGAQNVTTVQEKAFSGCAVLSDIALPSLTSIGDNAFDSCASLSTFEFAPTLESIGAEAFSACSSLTAIAVPDSVNTIGPRAFSECYALENVSIPFLGLTRDNPEKGFLHTFGKGARFSAITFTSMRSIATDSFKGGEQLISVFLNEGLTKIERSAFKDYSLLTNITLPTTLTSIGDNAFENCSSLTAMDLAASSVTEVGSYAFKNCYSLSLLTLPTTLSVIPQGVAMNCSSLTEILINEGVETIDKDAFRGSALQSVEIKENIKTIGACAFYNCDGITELVIPATVTSIGEGAFAECSALTTATVPFIGASIENNEKGFVHLFENDYALTALTVTNMTHVSTTTFKGGEQLDSLTLNEGLHTIEAMAFRNFTNLTTVFFPSTLKVIGDKAFQGCTDLVTADLSALSPDTLGTEAFADCTSLSTIALPEGLSHIPQGFLKNATALLAVTLPQSVTSIGESAFEGSGLQTVVLSEGLSTIEAKAFYNCDSLTELVIPTAVTSIGKNAFAECSALTAATVPFLGSDSSNNKNGYAYLFANDHALTTLTVTNMTHVATTTFKGGEQLITVFLNEGVTAIDKSAFKNFSRLSNILLPATLTSIGDGAFENCSSLSIVDLSSLPITYLGQRAFKGCSMLNALLLPTSLSSVSAQLAMNCRSLTTIHIHEGISKVERSAFEGSGLQSIEFTESLTTIEDRAFYNCDSLTALTVPQSVTYFGKNVFAECSSLTSATVPFLGETAENDKMGYSRLFKYDYALTTLTVTNMTHVATTTFKGGEQLDAISLNEGVTTIEKQAFQNFTSLSAVSLPTSLKVIGDRAFQGCTDLSAIDLSLLTPDSLGTYLFSGCARLSIVILPQNMTYIPEGFLKDCTALNTIVLPETITSIEANAFQGSRLTELTLPAGITSIGANAFRGVALTELTIPDSLQTMGQYAFAECYSLSVITTPFVGESRDVARKGYLYSFKNSAANMITLTSMHTVDANTFQGGERLNAIVLNEGLTSVGDRAFKNCTHLTTVIFPTTLTVIGNNAFENCYALTAMDLTATAVTEVGSYAFKNCTSLSSLILPVTLSEIPAGVAMNCSALTEILINEGVEKIGNEAFRGSGLSTIEIKENVKSIGDKAFYGCRRLTELFIPATVTHMGKQAFGYCSSLTSATVPFLGSDVNTYAKGFRHLFKNDYLLSTLTVTSMPTIGSNTFSGATQLTTLTLCEGVTTIQPKAFRNLLFLSTLSLPTSLTTIGDNAFQNCAALGVVDLSETSVTSVGKRAFYNCDRMTQLVLPQTITSIPDEMAATCNMLTTVVLPDALTHVGNKAFNKCFNLSSIYAPQDGGMMDALGVFRLPASVQSIGNKAFAECVSMTSVIFPAGLKTVGNSAFYGCTRLQAVAANDGLAEIGSAAFAGCTSLTELSLPTSLTKIGRGVCNNCTSLISLEIPFIGNTKEKAARLTYVTNNKQLISISVTAAQKIAKRTFADCTKLASLSLNDGIQEIGENVVENCTSLVLVQLPESLKRYESYFPQDSVFYPAE